MGVAGAIVIGGALAAGGAVAGGLLGAPETQEARTQAPTEELSPALGAAQFEALLSLGILDASSIQQIGPIGRFVTQVMASPARATDTREDIIDNLTRAYNNYKAGRRVDFAANFKYIVEAARQAGYPSITALFDAEDKFQAQVPGFLERSSKFALQNLQTRRTLQQQLGGLVTDFPGASASDIEALRTAENARLQRQIDELQTGALRGANVAGINPGRQLEGLDRARLDADLESLQRAITLLGGQQALAINQGNFMTGMLDRDIQNALNVATFTQGTNQGFVNQPPPIPNPLGPALTQAGQSFGSSIANAALIPALMGSGRSGSAVPAGPTGADMQAQLDALLRQRLFTG